MNYISLLYCCIFFIIPSVKSAENQLKCQPSVTHVSIVPIKVEGLFLTTYRVNVLCFIQCSHHNGENGLLKKYSEDIGLVKGTSNTAYSVGQQAIESEAHTRLLQECKDLSCDCVNSRCPCKACTPPPMTTTNSISSQMRGIQVIENTKQKTSISSPFVLKKVKNINGISKAQREYINKHYEAYTECGHMYTMRDGRYIHIVLIGKEDSPSFSVYFDMTDVYKSLERSGNKATKLRIRKLMEDHIPLEVETEK